jgi:hypothetical protein
MRKLASVFGLSVLGLACQQQEPAAAPLAAPAPAGTETAAAAPAAAPGPAAAKPAPLPPDQVVKNIQDCWAAYNAKDWAKFGPCYAENAVHEDVDSGMPPVSGRANIIEKATKPWATAFPDGTGELQLTLLNGKNAVAVVLFRGNNKGPLASPTGEIKATNKKVGMLLAQQLELSEDGRTATVDRITMDGGTLMGQLGLNPGPHRKVIDNGWAEKPVVIAANNEIEKTNLAASQKGVESFNKHDVPGIMALVTDDVVFSDLSAPADRTGKKEVQKAYEELFKGFPDVKLDVKSAWAAGDYVVSHGTFSGTNTGDIPSMKLKKTGKKVSVQFVEIDKLQGGKLKQMWIFNNGMAFASQLGLLPPPKPAAAAPAKPADPKAATKPAIPAAPPGAGATPATPAKPADPKAGTPATPAKPADPKAAPAPAAPPAAKPAPAPAAPVAPPVKK